MTDQATLAAHIDRLADSRVLCIGDVMLDRFVYGAVERISPEAPIPVVRIERETAMLGGAGNVVANLTALGARPVFLSVVGDDAQGREVGELIAAQPGTEPALLVEPGRQTTIKTRYFAAAQQLLRADKETTAPLTDIRRTQVIERAGRLMPEVSVVVLSDYGKGLLEPDVAQAVIKAAKLAGKPVIVDPKGADYALYAGATLVTPNRKELKEATRMPVDSDDEIVAAARSLIDAHDFAAVLATRSQDGMTLVAADGTVHHLPAQAREVFDVSGAGDTVVATLAAALGGGVPMLDAAKLANVAASIVVGKVGTAATTIKEMTHALHQEDLAHSEQKIVSLEEALERLEKWRREGRKVGFTNGCFDLLHPGHISLLRQARGQCDRLVVGLNSDASVSRLKGPTRPVQTEMARATVLASLETVNLVVIFGEDTPLKLIEALRPDVLVKGQDYTVETVVGAEMVQSYGGRVFLANLEDGFSTTNTIRKMNGGN